MFSLFLAFLIYILQVGYNHLTWNFALATACKFLFYWNSIFASITIFFFLLMLLGLSTLFFKVPFIGIGIYRFNEKIRETGIPTFLLRTSLIWLFSRSFIIFGSYFIAFEMPERIDLLIASLALILTGYLIKKQTSLQNGAKIHSHFSIHNLDSNQNIEKDITPSAPKELDENRK